METAKETVTEPVQGAAGEQEAVMRHMIMSVFLIPWVMTRP